MKYPPLPDKDDLRKKLMDSDIASLKAGYAQAFPFSGSSYRQWMLAKAEEYGVSHSTIQYHTNDSYRAKMKAKNASAHSKAHDLQDYEAHRAGEMNLRMLRWERNPLLREWHYEVSARNEKRSKRKTSLGRPLRR
jgi:hypothetical protein